MNRAWKKAHLKPHSSVAPVLLLVWLVPLFLGSMLHSQARGAELLVPSPHWASIGEALKAAEAGDTISIAPGVYRERLRIRKSVTLKSTVSPSSAGSSGGAAVGEHPEQQVVIHGGGTGRTVEVFAPKVTLQGLHLQGSGDSMDPPDACIYAHKEATGLRVQGNAITDCAFGIWINGAVDVRLVGNFVKGRPKPIFSNRGNGIHLWSVSGALVRDNHVQTVRDGIFITVSKNSRVENNRLWKVRYGIHYMYNDDNRITGNLSCNSVVGLAMMFSKRLEIRGNTALNNTEHGIFFRSIFDSRIIGNSAMGNQRGFVLNEASFNTFSHNHVEGNAIGLVVTGGSEDNRIMHNDFMGNPVQVQYTWQRPLHWDDGGQGNYWGDYLGWDRDQDGYGETPYYSANRMDWLVLRYPQVKLLAASPVVSLMQALEVRFPVLRPAGVVDRYPALQPFQRAVNNTPGPAMQCETSES